MHRTALLAARCGLSGAAPRFAAAPLLAPGRAVPRPARALAAGRPPLPHSAGRRGAASTGDAAETPALIASAASNAGKFAGALAHQFRARGYALVHAVGPHAAYTTVKAVIIAERYLEDILEGKTLAIIPSKHEIASDQEKTSTVGLALKVVAIPTVAFAETPEVFSSKSANVGLMAGLMSNVLKDKKTVVLGSMGADAVGSAFKATIIARGFMAERLGDEGQLALVPRRNEFEEYNEIRIRILLCCTSI